MYKLTVESKNTFHKIEYIFNDLDEIVTFMEVSLKKSESPVSVTIELVEKEGDQDDGN